MRYGKPPDRHLLKGKRDRALLALLLACGLRRQEAVTLTLHHLQQREEHWAIVDLVGKGGHVRTVPVPDWVRTELEDWLTAARIDGGRLFRRVNEVGRAWSKTDLGAALPRIGRRVEAGPISLGARFGANYRTLPWLQATNSISRQRSHWH
jgi:integrase